MFSSKVHIPPSVTVAINSIAQQKKKAGQRIYNLSAGEPIVNTAHYLKQAALEAIEKGKTLYPPVAGLDELRTAAFEWMNKLYKTSYSMNTTLVTCGGKFGIYLSLQALLNEGDEVVIIAPYWVSYPSMVQLFGGKPVFVDTSEQNGWKVDVGDLEKAFTSRTKLLILNNGSNPTGVLYTQDELCAILELASRYNVLVLSDEVYSGLAYDSHEFVSCGSFPEYQENVLVIQSASKNFGMTGWRVGFVFAPEKILKVLTTLQGQSITGTSIVSQWAALAAFKQSAQIMAEIKDEMQKRRDLFVDAFNKLFNASYKAPLSAFYAFIPMTAFSDKETDDVKFCGKVLEQAGVAMVPGTAFGKPGYVRFSFGETPNELTAALKVLAGFLK